MKIVKRIILPKTQRMRALRHNGLHFPPMRLIMPILPHPYLFCEIMPIKLDVFINKIITIDPSSIDNTSLSITMINSYIDSTSR